MHPGAITGYIDVAQLVLYAFWLFFAGLIFYLRREDKREGYPLISERSGHVTVQGFPAVPRPKTFRLPHGGTVSAPRAEPRDNRPILAKPIGAWLGAPLQPTGNPMQDAVGPAAYAEREDKPELTLDGRPLIVPMRVETGATVAAEDADPRGMTVIGADGRSGGTVQDLWIDRSEPQIRYLEVAVADGRSVLLPMTLALIQAAKRQVKVSSVLGSQVAGAPMIASPDQVTKLEEDRICAYFASGHLYATPARQEPLL